MISEKYKKKINSSVVVALEVEYPVILALLGLTACEPELHDDDDEEGKKQIL